MEKNDRIKAYLPPEVELTGVETQNILCQSQGNRFDSLDGLEQNGFDDKPMDW